jgi:hypothetical protein
MLTLVKICACSAAAVALSSPTSLQAPPADSDVAAAQPPSEVTQQVMLPTCGDCNFWVVLPRAR